MRSLPRGTTSTVLRAGVAGWFLIDLWLVITHGLIFHDATVLEVSQWDASNAMGRAAFFGGVPTALLGLAMHFVVSIAWAALYVTAALRYRVLRERPVLAGFAFGLIVMGVMKYLIVPLGHAHQGAFNPAQYANQILAHTVAFGIPVALIVAARLRAPRVVRAQ
jgi:uncharacterized membrane protein YagU involved in acid resistance